ncbi:hypothetical protein BY458DRAFT_545614 [Sporodiniella umbellata]|nr:hypothetical protein BY458DRAFT_545614 [Sporodiniella umbellata]
MIAYPKKLHSHDGSCLPCLTQKKKKKMNRTATPKPLSSFFGSLIGCAQLPQIRPIRVHSPMVPNGCLRSYKWAAAKIYELLPLWQSGYYNLITASSSTTKVVQYMVFLFCCWTALKFYNSCALSLLTIAEVSSVFTDPALWTRSARLRPSHTIKNQQNWPYRQVKGIHVKLGSTLRLKTRLCFIENESAKVKFWLVVFDFYFDSVLIIDSLRFRSTSA